jgi:hypothetical protein
MQFGLLCFALLMPTTALTIVVAPGIFCLSNHIAR